MKKKLKEKQIPVSLLKNNLLDIVRKVEKGDSYQITKMNKPVALLIPLPTTTTPVINYSKITINGDVESPLITNWSYDKDNI